MIGYVVFQWQLVVHMKVQMQGKIKGDSIEGL